VRQPSLLEHDDYAVEPIPGLPKLLPPGEDLLWQGKPDWRAVARRVFHVRKIAFYFGLLAIWRVGVAVHDGASLTQTALTVLVLAALAALSIGVFVLVAWLIARTTIYSITSKRVILRFGVALPMTINVPYTLIESAGVRLGGDGTGDIAIQLAKGKGISYVLLWPHARPWRYGHPEPMFRALTDAEEAGRILTEAYRAAASVAAPAATTDLVIQHVPAAEDQFESPASLAGPKLAGAAG
jgi:hypothetical protein